MKHRQQTAGTQNTAHKKITGILPSLFANSEILLIFVALLGNSGSCRQIRCFFSFLWHSLLFLFLFPYRLRMENQNTIDCIPTDAFAKIRFHRNLRIRDALPTRCTVCQYILLPPHLLQDMKMMPYLVSPNPEISLPGLQTRTENAVSLPGRAGRYGLPAKRMANCLKK